MSRTRALPWLAFVLAPLLALGAAACTVGTSNQAGGDDDGDSDGGGDGDGSSLECDQPVDSVAAAHPVNGGGAGLNCLTAGCHLEGQLGANAPAWTIGGTIYTDVGGTAPLAGATIHATDADGTEVTMVSGEDGNFWTDQDLTFPVATFASRCPDERPMISMASIGSCNQAACHEAARIYLTP